MRRVWPLAAVLLLALSSGVAQGELAQNGNIRVSFDGDIAPRLLPRTEAAPVAISIKSTITTTDESDPPPQLRRIAMAINREGQIFDRGLPTCKVRRIQPATIAAAKRLCGNAIVGSGRVRVRVALENQAPFTFRGPLLVFNATRVKGERRLLAQVYGRRPPSAFVLTFRIRRSAGQFGNVVETRLPSAASKWAYVTHFEMKLQRRYTYRGKRRSFLSAGCPAPEGAPGAVYNFARSTLEFAGKRRVATILVRDCRAR